MTNPLSTQFAELAKEATQGHMRSMRDGNQYLDGLHSADGKSLVGASRVDGLDRPWNRGGAKLFIDMEHVSRFRDADADFIAFCFNNRTAILAALKEKDSPETPAEQQYREAQEGMSKMEPWRRDEIREAFSLKEKDRTS